ncbi:hypothetical protein C1I89_02250 [Achromobacter pulmonis]|uniref:Uncharacterized protein n=1 Tax=Achromobacter pulmonis TaxID=1389932 RepID=A0A2N8KP51_9BURK|nr:hypothetical protein C1I89_02250 [Achromobacter pulmonis]
MPGETGGAAGAGVAGRRGATGARDAQPPRTAADRPRAPAWMRKLRRGDGWPWFAALLLMSFL